MATTLLWVLLVALCFIATVALKTYKQAIMTKATELVQKVESAVQGSGLGPKKKALVIAQLEAAGIKVNKWLDKFIDLAVLRLNETKAWLVVQGPEVLKE